MSNELEQMIVQLSEKDQLVEALTTRLEQAAEQLDRIRRTGSDRAIKIQGGTGSAAISPEFLDQQKQISTDIQNMSDQWTEMESTGSIARIETKIADVRDLIIDLSLKQVAFFENGSLESHINSKPEEVSSFLDQIVQTSSADNIATEKSLLPNLENSTEDSSDTPFDFNALKNSLLQTESDESEGSSEIQIPAQDNQAPEQFEETIDEITQPTDIAFKNATHDQLCEAVEQRDAYISYLLRKLRVSQTLQISMPDWDSLAGIPEELLKEAHKLSLQLNEQLTLAEVENSVERARLGREANRLQQLQAKIDKEKQKLDQESIDDKNDDETDSTSSRWMRMLSRNRKNDNEDE